MSVCVMRRGALDMPARQSEAEAEPCAETAVISVTARCRCGHESTRSLCAEHAIIAAVAVSLFCRLCAQAGHECPLTVTL